MALSEGSLEERVRYRAVIRFDQRHCAKTKVSLGAAGTPVCVSNHHDRIEHAIDAYCFGLISIARWNADRALAVMAMPSVAMRDGSSCCAMRANMKPYGSNNPNSKPALPWYAASSIARVYANFIMTPSRQMQHQYLGIRSCVE